MFFSDKEEVHVFFFNVGQGNFCLLRYGSNVAIIDVSKTISEKLIPITEENIDTKPIVEFQKILRAVFNGTELKTVIFTHNHEDHIGGFENLLRWIRADKDVENYLQSPCFLAKH